MTRVTGIGLAFAFSLGLLAGTGAAQAPSREVTIKGLAFEPAAIEVKAGTVLTFRNADDTPHSVVAADGSFNSHEFAPGQSFTLTPTKAGTIRYFCGAHPFMEGQIIVKR